MTDPAFDYRRYAPLLPPKLRPPTQRPQLVFSQPDIPPRPDELALQLGCIRNSLVLIRQSALAASVILLRRFVRWCETNILHNLTAAWALGSAGWGFAIAFSAVLYFTR